MAEPTSKESFFVGYLPIPSRLSKWLGAITAGLAIALATLATLMGLGQRDPGSAVWSVDKTEQLSGRFFINPYPRVVTPASADSPATSILLVGEGKVGVAQRLRDFDGQQITLPGHWLRRDDFALFEVADAVPATPSPTPLQPPAVAPARTTSTAPLTFSGEIVDPKCYCGAMKPGDGKTHKACAALCLRGGIPPAFVAERSAPSSAHPAECWLLTQADGRGFTPESVEVLVPFVGDRVTLQGHPVVIDGQRYLQVDPATVHRLTP